MDCLIKIDNKLRYIIFCEMICYIYVIKKGGIRIFV